MRRSLLLSFIFLHFGLNAQLFNLSPLQKANKEFDAFGYSNALKYYQIALEDNTKFEPFILERIAMCFHKLNQPSRSETWFKRAIDAQDNPDPKLFLYLAEALASNEHYNQAITWYERYGQSDKSGKALADRKIEMLKERQDFLMKEGQFSISKVSFNSNFSDFSPTYHKEGIVFVSSRSGIKWVQNDYNWDESSYLDMFYFNPGEKSVSKEGFGSINTKYHDGPGQFYDNDKKLVFTRSSLKDRQLNSDKEGVTKLQIYFAEWNEQLNKFMETEPFPHNNKDFSFGHPTVNEEGSVILFISDMPGGFGGTDIYVTYGSGNVWTKPKNLGESVNTSGNEVFPFLVNDSLLVFSSNGHGGIGGLDLFKVELKDLHTVGDPKNLGIPFNSPKDDFGFASNSTFTGGYFSSNREEELNDEIYQFIFEKPDIITLKGVIQSLPDSILLNECLVSIRDQKGNMVASEVTNASGEYAVEVPWGQELVISCLKNNYTATRSIPFNTASEELQIEINLFMTKVFAPLAIEVVDSKSEEIVNDPIIKVTDYTGTQILPERSSGMYKVEPDKPYLLTVAKEGYYTGKDTMMIDDNVLKSLGKYNVALRKIVVGESIRLDNIYYDVNSANLREVSKRELDKVLTFMIDNPGIKIELSSHTDSRGAATYNLNLSQRRAESATEYLVTQGVPRDRIIPKGYGESDLINDCGDGKNCSEQEHQVNRRTEIKILDDH